MPPKPGALSLSSGKSNSSSKTKPPSDGMKCTHCGNSKHTRDTCFKLHGYLDWWNDLQAWKKRENSANDDHTGRATVVTCDPSLSLIPQVESSHDLGTSVRHFISLLTMMMMTRFSTLEIQTTWHLIQRISLVQLSRDEAVLQMPMGSLIRLQGLEQWLYLLPFHYLIHYLYPLFQIDWCL